MEGTVRIESGTTVGLATAIYGASNLFNGGVIGFGLLMLFFLVYLLLVMRKIRQSEHAPVYISLLTGFLSVSIAAASNPYLSSFDFLFALSIIPLILNTKDQTCQRQIKE